ncbi:Os08g0233300 [Oryza sativa Japonica Group]|uniref:Os08g0233300 protein n=1 Tax=Oryza sativa subsp. japonica TaxID=39947 RepID=Q6YYR8_ORYSJ|nr:unknown protein [Oryza sativa Japonica Group]BAF23220.1 Os08g0233300 [Oryza sativa Japonica Group]|eukprot:NP_001061306.1 Os08g0233300 [Oryza sativa Japonica Group]
MPPAAIPTPCRSGEVDLGLAEVPTAPRSAGRRRRRGASSLCRCLRRPPPPGLSGSRPPRLAREGRCMRRRAPFFPPQPDKAHRPSNLSAGSLPTRLSVRRALYLSTTPPTYCFLPLLSPGQLIPIPTGWSSTAVGKGRRLHLPRPLERPPKVSSPTCEITRGWLSTEPSTGVRLPQHHSDGVCR